ncbi:MAG: very short patch repair endonuclease [Gammaproteobacteria bacterium]|nr:very short patch repair endonuclease [Gammaproteobacteria bacterium]
MVDHVTREHRSRIMGRVRGRDTSPEMHVRRATHGMGFRYSLYRRDLPGTPDLVFPSRKKVILVHGCFWHQHNCPKGTRPASNKEFWNIKLSRNIQRDRENISALNNQGWLVLVIWECETKNLKQLKCRIRNFLISVE